MIMVRARPDDLHKQAVPDTSPSMETAGKPPRSWASRRSSCSSRATDRPAARSYCEGGLLLLAAKGRWSVESELVERLLEDQGLALMRFAYQLTHERTSAQDLVQEAAARMLKYAPRTDVKSMPSYAYKIIARLHHDQVSSPTLHAADRALATTYGSSNQDSYAQIDDQDSLWRALEVLSPRSRTILVLRYYADLNDREIADYLSCPSGTVRSRISRALKEMRKILTNGEDEK